VIIVPLFIIVRAMGMLNSYAGIIVPSIFNVRHLPIAAILSVHAARNRRSGGDRWRWLLAHLLERDPAAVGSRSCRRWRSCSSSPTGMPSVAIDGSLRPDLWVVQVGIANFKNEYSASWNFMMAASTIVAIDPRAVLIFQRQIMDSIKTSGLK
jgi:multiple sugar transport system permease protein